MRLYANISSSDSCVPVRLIVARGPRTLVRAAGQRHAGVQADASVDGHTGAVDGGEITIALEADAAAHACDLAKVDGGEVVAAEADAATHAGDLAKVDVGEVVVVKANGAWKAAL